MVTITDIDYNPVDMEPIIQLDTGKKLKCIYNDGGESLKSTTRRQLENLIGRSYESENTLIWYLTKKSNIVKKVECKQNVSLEEATMLALQGKLDESKYEDENVESQLYKIYDDLINGIKSAFPDIQIEEKDWKDQGYKHRTLLRTPKIEIREGVYRNILIDVFYDTPNFPTYSYYLGASAEVVESSSNETSVAGLKSNGYEIKNEIPNCKISIKAYAGEDIIDKGQSIDEFTSTVLKAYNSLETYNIKRFI